MCGGIREFERMRAPASQIVSLLHQEMRQYNYDDDESFMGCYAPLMKAAIESHPPKTLDAAPAPAGLAIVAALGSDLVESVPATISPRGPIMKLHVATNQEKPCAQQRAGPVKLRDDSQCATGQRDGYESSDAVHIMSSCRGSTWKREEEKSSRRSSIFYSAFSPPKDSAVDMSRSAQPSADFLATCFLCHRPLGSSIDIYIYRGDRAFCSNECRSQHIVDDHPSRRLHQQNLPTAGEPAHCKDRVNASTPSPIIPVLG